MGANKLPEKFRWFQSILKVFIEKPTTATLNTLASIAGTISLWVSVYSFGVAQNAMNLVGFIASWAGLIGILYLFVNWIENQTASRVVTRVAVYISFLMYSMLIALAGIVAVNVIGP